MSKKNIWNNLKEGHDLEENLPRYANHLMTSYYHYSMIRLSMNYYTFYEILGASEEKEVLALSEKMNVVHDIINKLVLSKLDGEATEDSVQKLDELRGEVIKKMKVLTSYIDIFQNYEYVLNRMEHRFKKDLEPINDEAFAQEIMQFIFNTKDSVIINSKIQEVIGQLPVRMTKARYFEILKNSLSMYKGSEKESLDNYLYMLRTSSMLYQPEGMNEYFPELIKVSDELKNLSYKDLDEEGYKKYANKIDETAVYIGQIIDGYAFMQEVLNNLYTVILSAPYVMKENSDDLTCKGIIKFVYDQFMKDHYEDIEDKIIDKLESLEGHQEEIYEEYTNLEMILSEVKEKNSAVIESLMLSKIFHSLDVIKLLLSTSLFVELNEVKLNETVDEAYLEKVTTELVNELTDLFKNSSQSIMRAVVSNTISKMPVFFSTPDEVTEYVTSSLSQCKDMAEKYACRELIRDIMSE
ncbi:hypothetical protein [Anaeromicropila herbilytica]|uniref:Uncharacterized protein n=1 Tax=Anaeromicropila herbilytica TaxID=2785025 RepID=A0A7R7EKJ1_9FIRM|nr:hypothetical protein [Anaeromicropila herbilytica]BCN30463.1 hypothetical protein bsdtb5_17580 [Anaeromicropila herbilytica]